MICFQQHGCWPLDIWEFLVVLFLVLPSPPPSPPWLRSRAGLQPQCSFSAPDWSACQELESRDISKLVGSMMEKKGKNGDRARQSPVRGPKSFMSSGSSEAISASPLKFGFKL